MKNGYFIGNIRYFQTNPGVFITTTHCFRADASLKLWWRKAHFRTTLDFGVSFCGQVKRIVTLTLQPLVIFLFHFLENPYHHIEGFSRTKQDVFYPCEGSEKRSKTMGIGHDWTRKNVEIQPNKPHVMGT